MSARLVVPAAMHAVKLVVSAGMIGMGVRIDDDNLAAGAKLCRNRLEIQHAKTGIAKKRASAAVYQIHYVLPDFVYRP